MVSNRIIWLLGITLLYKTVTSMVLVKITVLKMCGKIRKENVRYDFTLKMSKLTNHPRMISLL